MTLDRNKNTSSSDVSSWLLKLFMRFKSPTEWTSRNDVFSTRLHLSTRDVFSFIITRDVFWTDPSRASASDEACCSSESVHCLIYEVFETLSRHFFLQKTLAFIISRQSHILKQLKVRLSSIKTAVAHLMFMIQNC